MKKFYKKFITLVLIIILCFTPINGVWALDAPEAPTAPTTPTAPTAPSAPEAPSSPTIPESDNTTTTKSEPAPTSTQTQQDPTLTSQPTNSNQVSDGNSGDTAIITGDTTNSGTATTLVNINTLANGSDSTDPNGTQVINSDNGSSSENSGTVTNNSSNTTNQDNNANVGNNLTLDTTTGDNSVSKNTGGDALIQTGDANTSGTLINSLNTNAAGVAVSEFNVADNQTGDLVLDFAQNCISGCGNFGPTSAQNVSNGTDSTNTADINQTANNTTTQTNDAIVTGDLNLSSNSGDNTTSKNTGGDSVIKTGDANTSGSILSFLNNNIAGQVILGVVNIFGNLVGDIILPESSANCTNCSSQTITSNISNGTDSTNTTGVNQTTNDATFQANAADIQNNLILQSDTGDNSASYNTGGDAVIKTGTAETESQTINIINTNVDGGPIWLVLVNQMGQWVGKILGAPTGSNVASSDGTEVSTNPDGTITVTNSGNGAGSENSGQITQNTSTTTTQENNAKLVNNLNLSANSGGNDASANTGGTSFIQTGDAKVIANLVNFVNNNIASGQKMVVTIVNVFGSWLGDFVTPGTVKETAQGGTATDQDNTDQSVQSSSATQEQSQDEFDLATPPQPTPTITTLVSQLSTQQSIEQSNNPNNQTAVAGISSNNNDSGGKPEARNDRKIIKLNLAWLLLLLPFGGAGAVMRFRKLFTL